MPRRRFLKGHQPSWLCWDSNNNAPILSSVKVTGVVPLKARLCWHNKNSLVLPPVKVTGTVLLKTQGITQMPLCSLSTGCKLLLSCHCLLIRTNPKQIKHPKGTAQIPWRCSPRPKKNACRQTA